MTRLQGADLAGLAGGLAAYDRQLLERTGCTLFALACRAAGLEEGQARRSLARTPAAVVPMDCGQGLIPGFAEAVCAILRHLGCPCVVTSTGEVAGLAEAFRRGSRLIMSADDYRFVALVPRRMRVVDNAGATARGFTAGLALMAGGLKARRVLVIGCGEVGTAAARRLLEEGARVSLYDIQTERSYGLAELLSPEHPGAVAAEPELSGALSRHRLLFEATPVAGTVPEEWFAPESLVAAPGLPLGLSRPAAARLGRRLLHDPLQIGVATMAMEALKP